MTTRIVAGRRTQGVLGDPDEQEGPRDVVRDEDVVLLEVQPDRVRLRPQWPSEDDDPAGEWVEVASLVEGGLRPARR